MNLKPLSERRMPSISALAEYWANRCLKCDSSWNECESVRHKDYLSHDLYCVFCDSGEPECMRCGSFLGYTSHAIRHTHGKCGKCRWEDPDPDCTCGNPERCGAYPRARADRAHIVARWQAAYGDAEMDPRGIDALDNMALLCHECHRVNPEPPDRRSYLDWLMAERKRQYDAKAGFAEWIKANPSVDPNSPILHALIMAMLPDTHPRRAQLATEIVNS
jgi:hypothetical protein